jgi:hypothetical protein
MICSSLKRFLFMASPPAISATRKTHLPPGPILGEKLIGTKRLGHLGFKQLLEDCLYQRP